jgi:hypothetical protein
MDKCDVSLQMTMPNPYLGCSSHQPPSFVVADGLVNLRVRDGVDAAHVHVVHLGRHAQHSIRNNHQLARGVPALQVFARVRFCNAALPGLFQRAFACGSCLLLSR